MKRHELTDEHWALIEPLVPPSKACTGRPPRVRRILLIGVFWILHTGVPWRDLPKRFGPWQTVYHHFAKWRREGVFAEIVDALQMTLASVLRAPSANTDKRRIEDAWVASPSRFGTSLRVTDNGAIARRHGEAPR